MKKLYDAANLQEAQLLKDQLSNAGFEVILQGEYLGGAVGEIPANTYPSLWLVDEAQYDEAKLLIEAYEQGADNQGVWICEKCGEKHQGQFSQCWRCGAERSS